jgi:trans-2,3-dihydro-3-hydroxyanthranilate isomerase
VRVEQGYEIRRPSLLYLRAEKEGDETIVHVGGKVQMVAKGELNEGPTPDKITAE